MGTKRDGFIEMITVIHRAWEGKPLCGSSEGATVAGSINRHIQTLDRCYAPWSRCQDCEDRHDLMVLATTDLDGITVNPAQAVIDWDRVGQLS